eukprot:366145-Chlamydomonas_euryale.AAC.6
MLVDPDHSVHNRDVAAVNAKDHNLARADGCLRCAKVCQVEAHGPNKTSLEGAVPQQGSCPGGNMKARVRRGVDVISEGQEERGAPGGGATCSPCKERTCCCIEMWLQPQTSLLRLSSLREGMPQACSRQHPQSKHQPYSRQQPYRRAAGPPFPGSETRYRLDGSLAPCSR